MSYLSRSLRGALVAVAALQIGCTSSSVVPVGAPGLELTSQGGIIELQDDHGRRTPVAPDSRVHFIQRNGVTTSWVRAGDLCRTETGLEVRNPRTGCVDADPLIRFDEIESVAVESWDRAATTGIIAGAAVVVVGLIVVVVMAASSGDKSESSESKSSSSSSSSSRSSSSSSSGRSNEALIVPALRVGEAMAQHAASEEAMSTPVRGPGPLFTDTDRRRASFQVLLDTDVSLSLLAPNDSLATGGRLGLRIRDFFDVSLGVRALAGEGRLTRPVPVLGVGFHGPLPRAPWFAIAVGGEIGGSSAIDFYATARLGPRLSPFSRFWVSLYPLHPTYTGWSGGRGDRWVAASTLEMSYGF